MENLAEKFAARAAGITSTMRWSPVAVADLIEIGQQNLVSLSKAKHLSREQIEVDAEFIAFCVNNRDEIEKALSAPVTSKHDAGKAVIEGDDIVIRVPIFELQTLADCAFTKGNMELKAHFPGAEQRVFAHHIVTELNDAGSYGTPVERLLGEVMDDATDKVVTLRERALEKASA